MNIQPTNIQRQVNNNFYPSLSEYKNVFNITARGVYNMYIQANSEPYTILAQFVISDQGEIQLSNIMGPYAEFPDPYDFSGNSIQFVWNNPDNTYSIDLQYVDGNIQVQLDSMTTATDPYFNFDMTYYGSDPTTGGNSQAIDSISSTLGSVSIVDPLTTSSGRSRNVKTITANTTLDNTFDIINCNPSSNITITLPQSSSSTGSCYSFFNNSTNTITISTFTGDTIDNGSTTTATLSTQYSKLTLTNLGNGIWFSNI